MPGYIEKISLHIVTVTYFIIFCEFSKNIAKCQLCRYVVLNFAFYCYLRICYGIFYKY